MLQVHLMCLFPTFELEAWWMWGYLMASPVLAALLLWLCLISCRPRCCGVCGLLNHATSLHWTVWAPVQGREAACWCVVEPEARLKPSPYTPGLLIILLPQVKLSSKSHIAENTPPRGSFTPLAFRECAFELLRVYCVIKGKWMDIDSGMHAWKTVKNTLSCMTE